LSSSVKTGPHCPSIPAYHSTLRFSTSSVNRSLTSGAVDLDYQCEIPRDLPLPPQPFIQAHFILNTSGQRRPLVGMGPKVGSRWHYGVLDGAGQLLDALVDSVLVVYCEIPRESVLKASLDCGPVHSREIGAVQSVLIG
jgi:hypothetical protein